MAGLESKVALITGAGGMKGIGRATALKLAAQGADIAVTDVHRPSEDLPPGEVRQQWRGIDSVAAEVEALGRRWRFASRRCRPLRRPMRSARPFSCLIWKSDGEFERSQSPSRADLPRRARQWQRER